MAQNKQQYVAPVPPHKFVLKLAFSILAYPFNVIKKYNSYNARIGEIVNELDDEHLDRFRKNNGKLLLRFVYYPFFLSLLISIFSIYHHGGEYQIFWMKLTRNYGPDFGQLTVFWKRINTFFTKIPIRHDDYFYFIIGYFLMIIGSKFLMLNRAFAKEAEIAKNFAILGYVDNEGKPWKLTWTPDAMMIETFHCDVAALCSSQRFWSTINFPPGPPKLSKKNMGKFIVSKAYELPSALEFEYKDDKPLTILK